MITAEMNRTEKDMREEKAPTLGTMKDLSKYITSLVEMNHNYGTCVYAMSLAATAAFNYVADKLGVTGFQASCADLDILRRTRCWNGPFIVLTGDKMLYPQYDLMGELTEAMKEWTPWAAEQAKKLLAEKDHICHPKVRKHWKKLAANKTVED